LNNQDLLGAMRDSFHNSNAPLSCLQEGLLLPHLLLARGLEVLPGNSLTSQHQGSLPSQDQWHRATNQHHRQKVLPCIPSASP